MSDYVNSEVPFLTVGNRQVLTDKQLVEMPWLRDFIRQFPRCFKYDVVRSLHVFDPEPH